MAERIAADAKGLAHFHIGEGEAPHTVAYEQRVRRSDHVGGCGTRRRDLRGSSTPRNQRFSKRRNAAVSGCGPAPHGPELRSHDIDRDRVGSAHGSDVSPCDFAH